MPLAAKRYFLAVRVSFIGHQANLGIVGRAQSKVNQGIQRRNRPGAATLRFGSFMLISVGARAVSATGDR